MKWLEIIEIRAVHIDQPDLQQQVIHLLDKMKNEYSITIYFNIQVETDWTVHVHHESDMIDARGSEFGRRMKEILKRTGLVNHSIWVEKSGIDRPINSINTK